jgi:hypothetical protein
MDDYTLDNIETEFKECIILDKQHREELSRYVGTCSSKNYLRLFDFIQRWKNTPDGPDRVDITVYICKIFVDSNSWKSIIVSHDLKQRIEDVLDIIDDYPTDVKEDVDYIMMVLEKIAVVQLMEVFVTNTVNCNSPRRKELQRTESFKQRLQKFAKKISFLRKKVKH